MLFALCYCLADKINRLIIGIVSAVNVELDIRNIDIACHGNCRIHFFNIFVRGVGGIAV